jgi:hypothetical protein
MPMWIGFAQAAAQAAAAEGIGAGALAFMLISMGAVALLTVWCFYRVITTRQHFDPDGTGPARAPVRGEAEPRSDT